MQLGLLSIVGMGRSGSTYLEVRTAEEFAGVAVGELPGVWEALAQPEKLCACGQVGRNCPFWARVIHHYPTVLHADTIEAVQSTNSRVLSVRQLVTWTRILAHGAVGGVPTYVTEYQKEVRRLYHAIAVSSHEHGYQIVVESSKNPIWYDLAHAGGCFQPFARADVWRLVRDPRAVVYSLARPKEERIVGGARTVQRSYSSTRAILYWLIMNIGADIATSKDTPVLRYEDLGDEEYLSSLEKAGYQRRASTPLSSGHQLVANPIRQTPDRNAFSLDERWRNEDEAWRLRLTYRLLRPVLRRYGYTASQS